MAFSWDFKPFQLTATVITTIVTVNLMNKWVVLDNSEYLASVDYYK